ncbi:MAG: GspH/FimT family pseudopilin [Thermoanaerobaculia bacterium]
MKKGYSLIEAMVVLFIVGLFLSVSIPALSNYYIKRTSLEKSLRDIVSVLRSTRQEAITRNCYVGVLFKLNNDLSLGYRIYKDGNGNGIRKKEIEKKTDIPLTGWRRIKFSEHIKPGILSKNIREPETNKKIESPEDPIKFGSSNICSFSPLGASSPGSVYFTDRVKLQGVVRVYPTSGKIRILYYKNGRWVE